MKKLILILSLPFCGFADNLPNGSWQKSCSVSSASYFKGVLTSSCAKNGGVLQNISKLNYQQNCQIDSLVDNDNGNLVCVTPKAAPDNRSATQFPGGDWVVSCKTDSASINGTMLIAKCRNDQGQFIPAAIDLATCKTNPLVHNQNGSLSCTANREKPEKDGLPAGQWRENCKVKAATLSMNVLRAQCKTWSGSYFSQFLFYDNCKTGSSVSSDTDSGDLSCDQAK